MKFQTGRSYSIAFSPTKKMLAGVRLKFKDIYPEIEGSGDPAGVLEAFLGKLSGAGKPH